jgi:hypothetical protein
VVALHLLRSFTKAGALCIEKEHANAVADHLQCIDAAVGDVCDALRGRWLCVRALQPELDFRRGTALLGPLSARAIDCHAPVASQKRTATVSKIDVDQLKREIGAFERRQRQHVEAGGSAPRTGALPSTVAVAAASDATNGYTRDLFARFGDTNSDSARAGAAAAAAHESIIVQIVDLVRLEHAPTAELFVDCVAILDRRRFALMPECAPRYRLRVSVSSLFSFLHLHESNDFKKCIPALFFHSYIVSIALHAQLSQLHSRFDATLVSNAERKRLRRRAASVVPRVTYQVLEPDDEYASSGRAAEFCPIHVEPLAFDLEQYSIEFDATERCIKKGNFTLAWVDNS